MPLTPLVRGDRLARPLGVRDGPVKLLHPCSVPPGHACSTPEQQIMLAKKSSGATCQIDFSVSEGAPGCCCTHAPCRLATPARPPAVHLPTAPRLDDSLDMMNEAGQAVIVQTCDPIIISSLQQCPPEDRITQEPVDYAKCLMPV